MAETLNEEKEAPVTDEESEFEEGAPSRLDEGEPVVARNFGLFGLVLVVFSSALWLWNWYEKADLPRFPVLWIRALWIIGILSLIIHGVRERAVKLRRLHGLFGYCLILFGGMLAALATVAGVSGSAFGGEIGAAVMGILLVGATLVSFVRDEVPAEVQGNFFIRLWHGLAASSRVQQVTVVGALLVVLFMVACHFLRSESPLPFGVGVPLLGLVFLLAFVGNEPSETWRDAAVSLTGVFGAITAFTGLLSVISDVLQLGEAVLPYGVGLSVLGLVFLWTFAVLHGTETKIGRRVTIGFGIAGAVVLVVALARLFIPALAFPTPSLRVPAGFLLCIISGLYVLVSASLASDNRILAMTRRELAAYFYSPVAYIVIAGVSAVAWFSFIDFVYGVFSQAELQGAALPEPVVRFYYWALLPVIAMVVGVPIITMRLLSEEQRTGTLEVLLTAPVDEVSVVLSKFFAAWAFFMVSWLPWAICPLALRVLGNEDFDYRPLLSYYFGMAFMSAGFLSMGLFFSSVTRNQIISAILSFAGMMALTVPAFIMWNMRQSEMGSSDLKMRIWRLLAYLNHMDEMLKGKVHLDYLIFFATMAIFWLFVTVKVLEARKWR